MKKMILGLALVSSLYGCGESAEVQMVKGGKLPNCAGGTMGQITDGFMKSPSWESDKTNNGKEFVNVTGEITYMEKPVKATIQFMLDKGNGSFQFQALEFNGVPQNGLIAGALLEKMCENKSSSVSNSHANANTSEAAIPWAENVQKEFYGSCLKGTGADISQQDKYEKAMLYCSCVTNDLSKKFPISQLGQNAAEVTRIKSSCAENM